jgi:DNA-binding GntR family transcriptional regulator
MKMKTGRPPTREQVRRAIGRLVRKGLLIKRWEPGRGTVYVAIQFATDEELIAARARYPSKGRREH